MSPPRVFFPVEHAGLVEPAYESTDSETFLPAAQAASTHHSVNTKSSPMAAQADLVKKVKIKGTNDDVSVPPPVAPAHVWRAVLDSTYNNIHCSHRPADPRDPVRVTHTIRKGQQQDSKMCQNTGCKSTVGR